MEITISGMFTKPQKKFDLSSAYLNLLKEEITKNILQKHTLNNVKAQELEIYICTDGTDSESSIQQITNKNTDEYLTFHFWISYPKAVKQITEMLFVEMDLQVFTIEFFSCLKEALKPYQIPVEVFELAQNSVLEILENDSEKYVYPFTEKEGQMRLKMRAILDKAVQEIA